jgi:hypothetical protein
MERKSGEMCSSTKAKVHTKVYDLAEIPSRSLVIDRIGTGAGGHFFGAHANRVDMRPPTFGFFTIRSSRVFEEIKGESELALAAMSIDVELGDDVLDPNEYCGWNLHPTRELGYPLPEVPVPLASDIVGEFEKGDDPDKGTENNEIHIGVPTFDMRFEEKIKY